MAGPCHSSGWNRWGECSDRSNLQSEGIADPIYGTQKIQRSSLHCGAGSYIYTYIYFCLVKFFIYSSTFKFLLLLSCQQLPRIDAVVISHSHYDHLDAGSVASLNARFGGELRWYVRWISGPQYYFHSCHMFTSHCQTVCPLLEITCTFLHCVCVSGSCQWVWWTGWWRWAVRMWWSWTGGRRTVSQVMMMSRLFAHPRSTGANAQHGMITK